MNTTIELTWGQKVEAEHKRLDDQYGEDEEKVPSCLDCNDTGIFISCAGTVDERELKCHCQDEDEL